MPTRGPGNSNLDIPGYRDVSLIGRGASSCVYKGFDSELARWVAIKVLLTDDADDPARRRFKREGEITANLGKHPHIVQVLGTGFTQDQCPYVVMEYFEEGSIGDRLRSAGTFGVLETVDIGEKIADAVAAAHKAGVLHRDIKPQNILLSEYGPALADFGIARAAANLEWSMSLDQLTPMHSPPETLMGGTSTAQSDIYSLGSTLYAMLAGRGPFAGTAGETPLKYQVRVMQDPVPPIPRADMTPGLTDVLERALAKNPADRFSSAIQFREALRRLQFDSAVSSAGMSSPEPEMSALIKLAHSEIPEDPSEDAVTQSRLVSVADAISETRSPFDVGAPVAIVGGTVRAPEEDVQSISDPAQSNVSLDGRNVDRFSLKPLVGRTEPIESTDDELTRSRHPQEMEHSTIGSAPSTRRSWHKLVLVVSVLVIVAGAGLGLSSFLSHKPASTTHGSPPAPVENSGKDKPTIGQIVDHGASETVNWLDTTATSNRFVVAVNAPGFSQSHATTAGATNFTFTGLNPTTDYCFTVAAYEGETAQHRLVLSKPATLCQSSRSSVGANVIGPNGTLPNITAPTTTTKPSS